MRVRSLVVSTVAAGAAALVPATAQGQQQFEVDLQTLNADYGSTASGSADLTLDTSNADFANQSGTASLRVQVDADGLEDLSDIDGAVHVGHIHGQFAGVADDPLATQGDGPFAEGNGAGDPGVSIVDSVVPTAADDGELNVDESSQFNRDNDYLDFFEGRPDYGAVQLNLSSEQIESAPSGTPPLNFFVQQAGDGDINPAELFPSGTEFNLDETYTFDLSDQDERRQFNNIAGPDGEQLTAREIVLHGLTIPNDISDAIDEASLGSEEPDSPFAGVEVFGGSEEFRVTAPVAAGEITAVNVNGQVIPTPSAAVAGLALLGGLGLTRRRRRG